MSKNVLEDTPYYMDRLAGIDRPLHPVFKDFDAMRSGSKDGNRILRSDGGNVSEASSKGHQGEHIVIVLRSGEQTNNRYSSIETSHAGRTGRSNTTQTNKRKLNTKSRC